MTGLTVGTMAAAGAAAATKGSPLVPSTPPLVAMMPTTDYYEIESKKVGTRFAIWVSRPEGHPPGKPIPAVYLCDGNHAVQSLASRSTGLWHDPIHPIEPLLLVSVGYVGAEAQDELRVRNRDLVPPHEPVDPRLIAEVDRGVKVGRMTAKEGADYKASLLDTHADRFLAFLTDELHPLIAKLYAVDTARCGLFGYSYGGLFATWTALQRPALFTRIGAGSPGMLLKESTVFVELERQQRAQTSHAGRHLHMTVNDQEIVRPTVYQTLGESFARFTAMLGATPLPGLDFSAHIVPGESHTTGVAPSWFSFLRAFYSA